MPQAGKRVAISRPLHCQFEPYSPHGTMEKVESCVVRKPRLRPLVGRFVPRIRHGWLPWRAGQFDRLWTHDRLLANSLVCADEPGIMSQ